MGIFGGFWGFDGGLGLGFGGEYKHKQELKMRNSRRNYTSYGRNRNTVKYSGRSLGTISMTGIISLMVLIVGLIYAAQSTKATSYDYAISEIDEEISELKAEKDDLAVERARLTSVAKTETSEVAARMEDGVVSGYARE
ncbi:MAG: hypothetical protein Q4F60_01100 [Candidatus Saccharibacteria bacterium]|nr:hypothetical protein [Candidatus Saccharibacteria bacterium]